jgi:ferric-dicitrate binding protein FerR (iron transport regulator)
MSDPTRGPGEPPGTDDPVARLIKQGGARAAAPDDRRARVRRSVHDLWSGMVRRDRRRRLLLISARLAAALAIVAGAGVWMWRQKLPAGAPAATVERAEGSVRLQDGSIAGTGHVLPAGARVTTASDGRAALRLIGGASVRLDIATELWLVSPRVLELRRGAVYVDSGARAADDPLLEITTAFGRVRDVGTQFEVRLANDRLRLSVREGAASLAHDGRLYSVPGGTSLRMDGSGAVETGTVGPRGEEWDWTLAVAPPFDLEGRTLRDYLAWLSRETGWKVEYADPSIAAGAGDVILHGSTAGLRPDQTPDAVLPTCGLRHRLDGATLTLARADDPGAGRDPGERP